MRTSHLQMAEVEQCLERLTNFGLNVQQAIDRTLALRVGAGHEGVRLCSSSKCSIQALERR